MIRVHWRDESKGDVDRIPLDWFAETGRFSSLTHEIVGGGETVIARCDVRVSKELATLDYRPHKKFNEAKDVYSGILKLQFKDVRRRSVSTVGWKYEGQRSFDYSVAYVRATPAGSKRPGHPGPHPSEWSRLVSRQDGATYTYLLRFGDRDIWKLGISQNPARRCDELNYAIPLDEKWQLMDSPQKWADGATAYKMEQALLKQLKSAGFERVEASEKTVAQAWRNYLATK